MRRADASNDVILVEDPYADSAPTVDSDWVNGDIIRLRAAHAHRRVHARMRFTDLSPDPGSGRSFWHVIRIRTPKKKYAVVGFDFEGSGDSHDFALIRGDIVRCGGLEASIDLEGNTVRVEIPRGCLGHPRWVRVGAATTSYIETDTDTTDLRYDTALATGTDADEDSFSPIPLGRRLRRC